MNCKQDVRGKLNLCKRKQERPSMIKKGSCVYVCGLYMSKMKLRLLSVFEEGADGAREGVDEAAGKGGGEVEGEGDACGEEGLYMRICVLTFVISM